MSRRLTTEQQTKNLTSQLIEITQQLNDLKIQDWKEQEEAREARLTSLNSATRRGLQIGYRAVALKNYQNLRGTEGTVIHLSTTFVTIHMDTGKEITRGKQNIKLVETDQ